MRKIIRNPKDTNSVWGDLSFAEKLDTDRGLFRSLSRRVFALVASVVLFSLGAIALVEYNLSNSQPNIQDVVTRAEKSIFEVSCGSSSGTAVAIDMQLPSGYKTGLVSATHIFDSCPVGSKIHLRQNGDNLYGLLARRDPIKAPTNGDYGNDVSLIFLRKWFPALSPAPAANVGDWAVLIGNPWNRVDYVTFGVISAVNFDEYETDAATNEGNSGGPLLDRQGRVLGIMDYKPLMADQNNSATGAVKTAEGIAAAKRLRVLCQNIFSGSKNCPFGE